MDMVTLKLHQRPGGRTAKVRCAALVAARQLFVPGQPLPTMAEIADRAEINKTSLYRNWGSVERLIHEAVQEQPYKGSPVPDTGEHRQDLISFAREYHAFFDSPEQQVYAGMLLDLPDDIKQLYWKSRYQAIACIFERAVERGHIQKKADWSGYIDLLVGPLYFYRYAKGEKVSLNRLLEIVEMICTDLKGKIGQSIDHDKLDGRV